MSTVDVVAGLGEIGKPILKLFTTATDIFGYDINPKLTNQNKFKKYSDYDVKFLHVCIPFNNNFLKNISLLYVKFNPKIIVIHSTVSPYTTSIQKKFPIPNNL